MNHHVGHLFARSGVLLLFHVVAATFPPLREAAGAEHRHRPQSHALVQGVGKDDAGGDRFVEVKSSGNVLDMAKVTKAKGGKLPKPHSRGRTRHREPSLATGGAKSSLSEAHRGWGGGEEGRASSDGEAELPEAVDLDQLRAQMPRLSLEDVVQEHEADIRRKIHELLEEHGMDPSKFKEHSMEFSKTKEPAKDTERTQKGFGVYENEHGSKIQMKVMHPGEFSAWRREPGRFNAMHMHEAKKYVDHHFDVARRQSRRSAMRKMRGFKEKAPTEDQAQFWDQQHEKLGAKAAADAAAAAAARNFTPAQRSSLSELGLSEALNTTAGGNCDTSAMGDHEECANGLDQETFKNAAKAPLTGLTFEVYFCMQIDIKLWSFTGLDAIYFHIGIQVAAKVAPFGGLCWSFTLEISLGVTFGIHLPFGLTLGIGLSAFGTGTMEQKTFAETGMSADEWKGPSGCTPAFATEAKKDSCIGGFSEVLWTGIDELGLLVASRSRPGKDALNKSLAADGGQYAKRQLYNWELYTKIFQKAPEEPENNVYRVNCKQMTTQESKLRCLIRTRTNVAWCKKEEGHCYRNQYQVSKERKASNNVVEWQEDDQAYSNFLLDHSTTMIEVGAGVPDFFATGKAQVFKALCKRLLKGSVQEDTLDLSSAVDWPAVSPDNHWFANLEQSDVHNNAGRQDVITVDKDVKLRKAGSSKDLTVQFEKMTRSGRLTVEVVEAKLLWQPAGNAHGQETIWDKQYVYAAVFLDPKVVLADTGPLFWTSTAQGEKVKWWGEGHAWSIFGDRWNDMKDRTAFTIALYSDSNVKMSSWTPPGALEEWCNRRWRAKHLWLCKDPCKYTPQCVNRLGVISPEREGCRCVAKNPTPQLRSSRDTARSSSDVKLGETTVTWLNLLQKLGARRLANHGAPGEFELKDIYIPDQENKKINIKVRLAWAPDTSNIEAEDVFPQDQDKGKLVFAATGLKHAKMQFLAKVRKLSEQVLERVWDNEETDNAEAPKKFKGLDVEFPARVKNFDCTWYVDCYMRSWDGVGGARLPRKQSDGDKVAYKKGVDPSYWATDDRVANLAKALREATQPKQYSTNRGGRGARVSHKKMINWDAKKAPWVQIKPTPVSDYAHSLTYYEEIAYSAANLFVRTIGDVQALFNVYFANQAQWDGLCSSLEPSFELPFEKFEFGQRAEERGRIPEFRYARQALEDPGDVSAAYYDKIAPRASLHEFPSRYTKGWYMRDPGTDVDPDILREFYIHNPASDHLWSYGHGFRPDDPNNNHKASMNFFTPDSPSVLSDHDDIEFTKSMPFAHEGDPSPTVYSRLWCDLAYLAFKKEVDEAKQRNFDQKWEVTIQRSDGKQPDYLGYQIHLGLNGTGYGGTYDETGKVLKMGPLFEDSLLWNDNVREGDSLYAVRGKHWEEAKALSEVVAARSLMLFAKPDLQKLRNFLLPPIDTAGERMRQWAQENLPMTLYFSRPQDQQDVQMLENLRKNHASSLAEEQPSRADEEGQKTAENRPSGDLNANGWIASIKEAVEGKAVEGAVGIGRTLKIERACMDMQAKAESDAKCEETPQRTCEKVELNTPFITIFPHLLNMFTTFYKPKINDILKKVQILSKSARDEKLQETSKAKATTETGKLIAGRGNKKFPDAVLNNASVLENLREDVMATLARWEELTDSKTQLMMEYAYELVYLVQLWLMDLGACGAVDGPLVESLLARPKGAKQAEARNRMCEEIHEHLSGAFGSKLKGLSSAQTTDFRKTLKSLFEQDNQRIKPKGNSVLNMMHRDFHAVFGVATAWPLAFQATKDAKANAKLTGHFWKYLAEADPAARTQGLRAKEAARAVDEEYLQKRLQSKMTETLQKYNMAIQPQGDYLVKVPFVETTLTYTIRIETAMPGFCTPNEALLLQDKSWSWTLQSWNRHHRDYQTCSSLKVHPMNWAVQLDTCRNADNDYKKYQLSFLLELGEDSTAEDGSFDSIFKNTDIKKKLQSGNFFSEIDKDGFLGELGGGDTQLPTFGDAGLDKALSGFAAGYVTLRSILAITGFLLDESHKNRTQPPAPSELFLKTFKKQLADNVGIIKSAKKFQETLRKLRKDHHGTVPARAWQDARAKLDVEIAEATSGTGGSQQERELQRERADLSTRMEMDDFRDDALPFDQVGVEATEEDNQERKPLGAASSFAASSAAAAAAALQLRPGAKDGGGMSEGAEDGDNMAEAENDGVEEEENPAGPAASSLAETVGGAEGLSEHGAARTQDWSGGKLSYMIVLQGSISIFAHKRKRLNELHKALYPNEGFIDRIMNWRFKEDDWTYRIASPVMSVEAWGRWDVAEFTEKDKGRIKPSVGLNIVLPLQGLWNTIATKMIACSRAKIVKECQECINAGGGWCDTRYMAMAEYLGKHASELAGCLDNTFKQVCESSLGWDRKGNLVSGQWIVTGKGREGKECDAIAAAENGEAWVSQDDFRNLEKRILEKVDKDEREQEEEKLNNDRREQLKQEYDFEKAKLLAEQEEKEAMLERIKREAEDRLVNVAGVNDPVGVPEARERCLECVMRKAGGHEFAFCLEPLHNFWGCAFYKENACLGVRNAEKTFLHETDCKNEFVIKESQAAMPSEDEESEAAMPSHAEDACAACLRCTRYGQRYCSADSRCEYYQDAAPTTCSSLEASMLLGAIQALGPLKQQDEFDQNERRAFTLLERQCFNTGMTCNDKERAPYRRDCCLDFAAIQAYKDGQPLVTGYKFAVVAECPQQNMKIERKTVHWSKLRLEMQSYPQGNVLHEDKAKAQCAEFAKQYLENPDNRATAFGPQAKMSKIGDMQKLNSGSSLDGMDPMEYELTRGDSQNSGGNWEPDKLDQLVEPQWQKSDKTIWQWIQEKLNLFKGSSTSNEATQQTVAHQESPEEMEDDILLPTWFYATRSMCEAEIPDCKEHKTDLGPLLNASDQIQRPKMQVKYRGERTYLIEDPEMDALAMHTYVMGEAEKWAEACVTFDGDVNGFNVAERGSRPCKGRVWSAVGNANTKQWKFPLPVLCSTCVAMEKKWCGTSWGAGTAPRTTWCEDPGKQCANGGTGVLEMPMCQAQDPIVPEDLMQEGALYLEMRFVWFCLFREDAYATMDPVGQKLCDRVIQAADMVIGDDDGAELEDLDLDEE